MNNSNIKLISDNDFKNNHDLDGIIYDLDKQIDMLSNNADSVDYLISIGSGLLCALLDIVWVGEFRLDQGRNIASNQVDTFVVKTAKLLGCKSDELQKSVKFLEDKFPIPSDGNTSNFGGGKQHHLRDFAHHPTIVGLMFSLLTQFTEKSYGTDNSGNFLCVDVPDKSKIFIGKDTSTKILYGTFIWFFHLVSDMAGSNNTVGKTGGTGIPGPILSFAKELSVLPFFKNMKIKDYSLSVFVSKLFNGTLLAEHDENGYIIKDTLMKLDFRGELGIAIELEQQALPVIANECIVRGFYFIRRFATELKENHICKLSDLNTLNWKQIKPMGNMTINRMITLATFVFTTVDVGNAIIIEKSWLSINCVGIGRFAVALGTDVSYCFKFRNIKKIQLMYENIHRNTFQILDKKIYERIGNDMVLDKFGLTLEQTEILYNIEYLCTLNDIQATKMPIGECNIRLLKQEWLDEWKQNISDGFSGFVEIADARLHWYDTNELLERIKNNQPEKVWFRLVLLEAMLFEPYYTLSTEKDKKGNDIPSKKYNILHKPLFGYNKGLGRKYLDSIFDEFYYTKGYITRLNKCYIKTISQLNEVLKTAITSITIIASITVVAAITAGAFAPNIAVMLVGSNFTGLSGAALTSACLAYLGGGAIAAGGLGMAGGTVAIVGGGAILGFSVGTGVGGTVANVNILKKKDIILQSAKLMVSVKEIFLNDEHDLEYSNTVYEQYVQKNAEIEKELVELRLEMDVATGEKKKELKNKIKDSEKALEVMKIARKSMHKFNSSFEAGLQSE